MPFLVHVPSLLSSFHLSSYTPPPIPKHPSSQPPPSSAFPIAILLTAKQPYPKAPFLLHPLQRNSLPSFPDHNTHPCPSFLRFTCPALPSLTTPFRTQHTALRGLSQTPSISLVQHNKVQIHLGCPLSSPTPTRSSGFQGEGSRARSFVTSPTEDEGPHWSLVRGTRNALQCQGLHPRLLMCVHHILARCPGHPPRAPPQSSARTICESHKGTHIFMTVARSRTLET